MPNKTIYTFWEPKENMQPYLKLCMKTWDPYLDGFNRVLIDYSNLFEFIPPDALSIEVLKKAPLAVQKDAVQVAVLKHNGGIFLDADMLLADDLNPLFAQLEQYDVITFSSHLAFMAARPNALLLNDWYEELQTNFEKLDSMDEVPWNFFGNKILAQKWKNKKYRILQINKHKTAYTPESNYFKNKGSAYDRYNQFWFSESINISDVFYKKQRIIALHNSWTPADFLRLDENQILSHRSLLSRALKCMLSSNIPKHDLKRVTWAHYAHIRINRLLSSLRRRVKLES